MASVGAVGQSTLGGEKTTTTRVCCVHLVVLCTSNNIGPGHSLGLVELNRADELNGIGGKSKHLLEKYIRPRKANELLSLSSLKFAERCTVRTQKVPRGERPWTALFPNLSAGRVLINSLCQRPAVRPSNTYLISSLHQTSKPQHTSCLEMSSQDLSQTNLLPQ